MVKKVEDKAGFRQSKDKYSSEVYELCEKANVL